MRESEKQQNENFISVLSKSTKQRMKIIWTVFPCFGRVMPDWEDIQVMERVVKKKKVSLEVIRVPWMLHTFILSMGRRFKAWDEGS